MRRIPPVVRALHAFALALICAGPARAAASPPTPALDPLSLAPDPTVVALAHQAGSTLGAWAVSATSTGHGTITPSGIVWVQQGTDQLFTLTPDSCYAVSSVIVDGSSVGAVTSYLFTSVSAPHTIVANFGVLTYSILASTGTGGSISPRGYIGAVCGQDTTFTITPASCYVVSDVIVDGVSQGAVTSYTFTHVTTTHTITAHFTQLTFPITAGAGPGGTISPAGDTSVGCGGSQTFTITPASCHSVADVVADGVSQGAVTSYTFTNVRANHTLSATFTYNSSPLTLTATAGTNGAITPTGTTSVACGGSQTYTITPDSCCAVSSVIVDGSSVGAVTSYTFLDVAVSHTISATFVSQPYFMVNASGGPHGTVIPSGYFSVTCGSRFTIWFVPDSCYAVQSVLVDGVSQGAVTSYTFASMQASHTISATFVSPGSGPYAIVASADTHGSISPSGTTTVGCGASQRYTISPDPCNAVQNVQVDGVSQGAITSYTFTNVTANHTISATFVVGGGSPCITATAGSHGTVSPYGTTSVPCGSNKTYTMLPNGCYVVQDVLVDGISQGAVTSYTFANVRTNHTISVTFAGGGPFTITATAGAHGSISPAGPTSVACFGSQYYRITADSCYAVSLMVDGVSLGPASSYNFTNVVTDHTISASFTPSDSFVVSASAGAHGAVSPGGRTTVACGSSLTITITPDTCARVAYLYVDNNLLITNQRSYTFTDITAAHTLYASFTIPGVSVSGVGCGPAYYTPVILGADPLSPNTTYGVDVRPGCTVPATGSALTYVETVSTDSRGVITNYTPTCVSSGLYMVILDLNGNGIFDPTCDAYTCAVLSSSTGTRGLDEVHATLEPDGPTLAWETSDGTTYRGFLIHRAPQGGEETLVTPTQLTPPSGGALLQMRWVDSSALPGTTYAYRIEALRSSGTEWYGPYTLAVPALPGQLALRNAAASPARGKAQLAVDVPTGTNAIRLDVYDIAGRHVRSLVDGALTPGEHVVEWDGRDEAGNRARGSVYVVRLQSPGGSRVVHVVLIN